MSTEASILNVALLQIDLLWEDAAANRKAIETELGKVNSNAHIIVLPEAFSTGFSMNAAEISESMNGATIQWMKEWAGKLNAVICGSVFIEENDKFYNRFLWVDAEGNVSNYDKRHLFSMGKENENYSAGSQQTLLSYKGWKIFPQVCYDLRFPVWSRNTMEYDLLINVANWPAPRRKVWNTLLKARAIENQCYALGVNRIGQDQNAIRYSGDSRVIDYKGQVLARAGKKQRVMEASLNLDTLKQFRAKFNTLKDADEFSIQS